MFQLSAFIKKGLLDAVGKMADYWIILNAAGWMEKGVLTEEDLAQIHNTMESSVIECEESITEEEGTDNGI